MTSANARPSNKWVLNSTDAPLFFLLAQLLIAVVLFIAVNALGLLQVPTECDPVIVKQMGPMVGLNVVGLRYVTPLSWYHPYQNY
jgi:solute carrier family 35 (GDP-fucose transporter), member C1